MEYTCVDAFTGAGGLLLGLQKAGFKTILAFDNDPRCAETQRLNPSYFHHETVRSDVDDMLNGGLLARIGMKRRELFLLAGGPPCQGFSLQRIGKDQDKRNNLVFKFISLVEEVLPKYFLMENVPGIEGRRGRAILAEALSEVARVGYSVHRKRLDAQDYGVPQRRKRVFVVGEERNHDDFSQFEFPKPTTPTGMRNTVRKAIGGLPAPPENGTDHPEIRHHRRDLLSETNKRRLRVLKEGQGRDYLPQELLTKSHHISSSKMGHRYVYGRMVWNDVAPTITARFDSFTRGRFGHPDQLRTISLREGALLQSFPMDFTFAGNKVEIARQIGNAVPPLLAEAIGRAIIRSYQAASERIVS